MFVSKDIKSLKKMIIYFAVFGLVYTVITTLLGFAAANTVDVSVADQAMPALLGHVPIILALIISIGIFAATSSTLGSIILTLSSMTTRDVAGNSKHDLSETKELIIGRSVIPVLLVICIISARLRLDLIAVLSAMASGGLLVTVPALIGTFFWRGTSAEGAILSMASGGLVPGSSLLTGIYPLGWWPSIWGFFVTLTIYISVSLITDRPEGTDEFLKTVDEESDEKGF